MKVDDVIYPMVEDLAQLTFLVNLNSIELHVPQWQVDEAGRRSRRTGWSSTSTPERRRDWPNARGRPDGARTAG